jgi:low affinity Fe/Cu permease
MSEKHNRFSEAFHKFANESARRLGSPWAFVIALIVIIVWAVTGPIFGFSDTWQLVINTGTTIVTFLMVFLIQNTQNRDARAIHLKLDELLRGVQNARTGLVNLEQLPEEELDRLAGQFEELQKRASIEKEEIELEKMEH